MCIACKVPLRVYIHTVYSICVVDRILNTYNHTILAPILNACVLESV